MDEDEITSELEGSRRLVELARIRTHQSAQRNYFNAERTLSVWVRTALAAMIFGIAIDRLGLMLYEIPKHLGNRFAKPDAPSIVIGALLVLFSILMALTSGIRFLAYARSYQKEHPLPAYHSPLPPAIVAFMVAILGTALLVFMIWIG